ncbi:3'-5' exoribonuclease [Aquisalimonas lutea]|uniref:3'-5' exoribonuclease n=1 Tax=Aquisalimonas lutea TaxID=1327750 RepID=UPI0025B50169|nr:3'-5' exoribonuclease [Aquisalimonas lutea]MDN3517266.1 3'-5' exoribonuclease [Aquisalimonas lutea]
MLIFVDTECTSLEAPKLLSVGFVAATSEPPEPFYVELTDTYEPSDCSAFVRREVIPQLLGGSYAMASVDARRQVRTWIEAFGEPAELVTDYPEFDARLLRDWFDGDRWPHNLARSARRLDPSNLPSGPVRDAVEAARANHEHRWGAHQALNDAARLHRVYQVLASYGLDPLDLRP